MCIINAAVSGHLELTLLKDRQRFDAISTVNLEVYTFRDWWILTYFIFGHGESSPNNIWSMVNLERTCVLFIFLFESESWPRKKQISLVNLHQTLFLRWWILTSYFWKRGELMVNPDLTILLRRWTEVKTWGGYVQDALWRVHKGELHPKPEFSLFCAPCFNTFCLKIDNLLRIFK